METSFAACRHLCILRIIWAGCHQVCPRAPLTAQSAHGPDPIQFQPKAPPVPSPPWAVWFRSLLIGQGPSQQTQPGGLRLRWFISPFGVLGIFGPGGQGGLFVRRLAFQQVLQVVQGQKVIVAFEKLLHKLQRGEKKRSNLIVRECTRETNSIRYISLLPPSSGLFSHILHPFWILLHPLFSAFLFIPDPRVHPIPHPSHHPSPYLRGIRRRVQSASLGDLQGCHEEQSDTKQHWTKHGGREELQEDWKHTGCKDSHRFNKVINDTFKHLKRSAL